MKEENHAFLEFPSRSANEGFARAAAACFAAKEAFLKAAGTGLGGFPLAELQALRKESGAPYYALEGSAAEWLQAQGLRAHLSLTHEAGLAAAMTVLEKMDTMGD